MGDKKKKISGLPLAQSLVGLFTIGVNAANDSVRVSLEWLKTAYDNVMSAISNANRATESANTAAGKANKAATDAGAQMTQISQEASAAIKAATDAAGNAQEAADNVQDGKTPILESVNAQSGVVPSGSFTQNGVDAEGNPKYILNLTSPKGKDGQPAIFEQGTTTTLEPAEDARVDVVGNGETEQGNPKYILNFFIPRGQIGKPGEGSGNVSADGTGLVIGKKYLFVPDSDGSTSGTFVEYVAPEIPEQVQPDWNATEGKGAILHKPGDATADASGLMSADQFQKLEKLSPSYLSNDMTGKKVEYTDDGKLLFEGKETFAVNANNELTFAGKKLSELGGGGGVYELPSALLTLDPSTATSDEIKGSIGGDEGFNSMVQAVSDKKMFVIELDGERLVAIVITSDTSTEGISLGFAVSFISFSFHCVISKSSNNTYTFIREEFNAAQLTSSSNTVFFKYSLNDGELMWNSHDADTDVGGTGPRYAAYSRNRNVKIENSGDGTKALMDDGTYKDLNLAQYIKKDGSIPFVNEQDMIKDGSVTYRFKDLTGSVLRGCIGKIVLEGNPVKNGMWFKNVVSNRALLLRDTGEITYDDDKILHSGNLNDPTILATTAKNGLMSSTDKTKLDRIGSYTTATTVANLNANYENIEISNLSANASLSISGTGTTYNGRTITAYVYCSSSRTITIPTSGSYISMCGSSYTCPAGKWVEFNLTCINGVWHIAKLEQQ